MDTSESRLSHIYTPITLTVDFPHFADLCRRRYHESKSFEYLISSTNFDGKTLYLVHFIEKLPYIRHRSIYVYDGKMITAPPSAGVDRDGFSRIPFYTLSADMTKKVSESYNPCVDVVYATDVNAFVLGNIPKSNVRSPFDVIPTKVSEGILRNYNIYPFIDEASDKRYYLAFTNDTSSEAVLIPENNDERYMIGDLQLKSFMNLCNSPLVCHMNRTPRPLFTDSEIEDTDSTKQILKLKYIIAPYWNRDFPASTQDKHDLKSFINIDDDDNN